MAFVKLNVGNVHTGFLVKVYSFVMNIESRVHQQKKSITLQIVTTKNNFQLMQGQQLQW